MSCSVRATLSLFMFPSFLPLSTWSTTRAFPRWKRELICEEFHKSEKKNRKKVKMKQTLLIILFIFSLTVSFCAQDVYVSPLGSDNPDCGALNEPCATISFGIEKADGGKVILVGGRHFLSGKISIEKNLNLVALNPSQPPVVDLSRNTNCNCFCFSWFSKFNSKKKPTFKLFFWILRGFIWDCVRCECGDSRNTIWEHTHESPLLSQQLKLLQHFPVYFLWREKQSSHQNQRRNDFYFLRK